MRFVVIVVMHVMVVVLMAVIAMRVRTFFRAQHISHDEAQLARQTLLAGISAPRRERLHAAVAAAIERLNPDAVKERAGEISDHLLKAGSFAD